MKINEVKFVRRYAVADYEFEEYTLTGIPDEDQNATSALAELKAAVEAAYSGNAGSVVGPGLLEDEEKEEKPAKKPGKKSKATPTTTPIKEDEDEDGEETDEDEDEEKDADGEEDSEDEDEDGEEEKEVEKPGKKAGKKKKPTVYQRANETHKNIMSGILKKVSPDWKKTDKLKARAKEVSVKMEGKDFLDDDGKPFASFQELVRQHMVGKK